MPPARLRSYVTARIVGGGLFAAIFLGWMWIQWSNPAMRFVALGLVAVTAIVTAVSIRNDAARARGRQVTVAGDEILIASPAGDARFTPADVAFLRWDEATEDTAGLWFHRNDDSHAVLAHLDLNFVGDQAEARAFLGWLRRQTGETFQVRWPD